jgi:hypothetical protein
MRHRGDLGLLCIPAESAPAGACVLDVDERRRPRQSGKRCGPRPRSLAWTGDLIVRAAASRPALHARCQRTARRQRPGARLARRHHVVTHDLMAAPPATGSRTGTSPAAWGMCAAHMGSAPTPAARLTSRLARAGTARGPAARQGGPARPRTPVGRSVRARGGPSSAALGHPIGGRPRRAGRGRRGDPDSLPSTAAASGDARTSAARWSAPAPSSAMARRRIRRCASDGRATPALGTDAGLAGTPSSRDASAR